MVKKVFLLIMLLQVFVFSLYAEDYNALSKLGRGLSNISLGWIEVPRQMIKVKQERGDGAGDVSGIFWGPLKGFTFFIGRTILGAYEVATFLVPSYKPLVKPEYIFSEEKEEEE